MMTFPFASFYSSFFQVGLSFFSFSFSYFTTFFQPEPFQRNRRRGKDGFIYIIFFKKTGGGQLLSRRFNIVDSPKPQKRAGTGLLTHPTLRLRLPSSSFLVSGFCSLHCIIFLIQRLQFGEEGTTALQDGRQSIASESMVQSTMRVVGRNCKWTMGHVGVPALHTDKGGKMVFMLRCAPALEEAPMVGRPQIALQRAPIP